jgi:uncharacterized protein YjbI with pentapeptide repeats
MEREEEEISDIEDNNSDMDIVDTISDISDMDDDNSESRKRSRRKLDFDDINEAEEEGDYKKLSKDELVDLIMRGELDLEPNLQNLDLSDVDLQSANLEYAILYGTNLNKTNLMDTTLTGANLTLTNLEEADLKNAIVGDTYFNGANLKKANLEDLIQRESRDVILTYLYFYYANLTNAKFTNNTFYHNSVHFSDFKKSMYIPSFDLSAAVLDGVTFNGSELSGILFSNLSMRGAHFDLFEKDYESKQTSLTECIFEGSQMEGCTFIEANIDRSDFTDAILTNTTFENCFLHTNIFRNANLENVKLLNCELEIIDFVGANLRGVDFSKSTFKKVDFTNADLTGAIVENAVFKEIVLNGTVIDGVDFSKAKKIENIQLDIRPLIPEASTNIFVEQGNVEQNEERIAYQIHDYFDKMNIKLDKIVDGIKVIVGKDDIVYKEMPNIAEYIEKEILDYLNNPELYDGTESKKNKMIEKLKLFMNGFKISSSSKIDENKIMMGNAIDFVMSQPYDFKKFYIESFIEDCSEAYGSQYEEKHRISCVKGIMERIFLVLLNTISIHKCNHKSEELCDEIKRMSEKKFGQEDLNKLTQEWLESVDLENPENKRKYGSIFENPVFNKNKIFKDNYLKFVYYYLNKNDLLDEKTIKMVKDEADKYEEMGVFGRLEFGGGKKQKSKSKKRKTIKKYKNKTADKQGRKQSNKTAHKTAHKKRKTKCKKVINKNKSKKHFTRRK